MIWFIVFYVIGYIYGYIAGSVMIQEHEHVSWSEAIWTGFTWPVQIFVYWRPFWTLTYDKLNKQIERLK